MRKALDSDDFLSAVRGSVGLIGLELLEVCFLSQSVLLVQHLFAPRANVTRQHPFFGKVNQSLPERAAYFSRCVTLELKTGRILTNLIAFEMAAVDVKCIIAGNWADFDFVGGCYRIRDQLHGVTTLGLPSIEHYTVTTVHNAILAYGEALFTSIGLSTILGR